MPPTYDQFNTRFLMTGIFAFLVMAMCLAMLFSTQWLKDRRRREAREDRRFEIEMEKAAQSVEAPPTISTNTNSEPSAMQQTPGPASGGYIVADLDESLRPLFHDLLKGFEDYARLKGYHLSFSVDNSMAGKIAFKFTILDEGVVVGQERVRRDFREYLEQVRNKDVEALDDLPIITSVEEHSLVVTLLKNRLSFLQHSYKLSQASVAFYENLLANTRGNFPVLPSTNLVVQTGGSMDSRSFSAVNSSKTLQGDHNTLADYSVNIGQSFREKQQRIAAIDDVIKQLKAVPTPNEAAGKAEISLIKVRDELSEEQEPNDSAIKKWLETAKNSIGTAALGYEAIEGARKLFELFGLN